MTSENVFICEICKKEFAKKRYLRSHKERCLRQVQRNQAKELANRCGICGKNFSCVSRVQKHQLLVHFNARDHQCNHCQSSFTQAAHLKRHIKALHTEPNEAERFGCKQCEEAGVAKDFPSQWELNRHQQKLHSISQYCPNCAEHRNFYLFTSPSAWLSHLDFHNGTKPHLCKTCFRGFKTKTQLISHEKALHLKQAVFECSSCGDRFVQRTQVERHLKKQHPPPSSYKCTCVAEFADRDSFAEHLELQHHMKGNLFMCLHCADWFSKKENLRRHVEEHHFRRITRNEEEAETSFEDSNSTMLTLKLSFSNDYKLNADSLKLAPLLPPLLLETVPQLNNLELKGCEQFFVPGGSVTVNVNAEGFGLDNVGEDVLEFFRNEIQIEL